MLLLDAPQVQVIAGENAVHVSQLPHVWQDIATGIADVAVPDIHSYVEMAQLFQYKLERGDVDLFSDRPELTHLKPMFAELFGAVSAGNSLVLRT